jgi:hypothetical protein
MNQLQCGFVMSATNAVQSLKTVNVPMRNVFVIPVTMIIGCDKVTDEKKGECYENNKKTTT